MEDISNATYNDDVPESITIEVSDTMRLAMLAVGLLDIDQVLYRRLLKLNCKHLDMVSKFCALLANTNPEYHPGT
tara:strand:+ start:727 stop:951 length:225 start_codon:yes stop_codon:yes gene_type:complete